MALGSKYAVTIPITLDTQDANQKLSQLAAHVKNVATTISGTPVGKAGVPTALEAHMRKYTPEAVAGAQVQKLQQRIYDLQVKTQVLSGLSARGVSPETLGKYGRFNINEAILLQKLGISVPNELMPQDMDSGIAHTLGTLGAAAGFSRLGFLARMAKSALLNPKVAGLMGGALLVGYWANLFSARAFGSKKIWEDLMTQNMRNPATNPNLMAYAADVAESQTIAAAQWGPILKIPFFGSYLQYKMDRKTRAAEAVMTAGQELTQVQRATRLEMLRMMGKPREAVEEEARQKRAEAFTRALSASYAAERNAEVSGYSRAAVNASNALQLQTWAVQRAEYDAIEERRLIELEKIRGIRAAQAGSMVAGRYTARQYKYMLEQDPVRAKAYEIRAMEEERMGRWAEMTLGKRGEDLALARAQVKTEKEVWEAEKRMMMRQFVADVPGADIINVLEAGAVSQMRDIQKERAKELEYQIERIPDILLDIYREISNLTVKQ